MRQRQQQPAARNCASSSGSGSSRACACSLGVAVCPDGQHSEACEADQLHGQAGQGDCAAQSDAVLLRVARGLRARPNRDANRLDAAGQAGRQTDRQTDRQTVQACMHAVRRG
jgi:hypothetical protein